MPTLTLPRFAPITPIARAAPFDSPDWLFEPLYDGHRALLHTRGCGSWIELSGGVRLEGLVDLRERIAAVLGAREVVLDGEVVSLDRQGRPIRDAAPGQGFLAYAAFDLLWLDGRDLRALPLSQRRATLATVLPRDTGPLFKLFALEEHGRALFAAARRMDLEGVVARRLSDPYTGDSVWYAIRNPMAGQAEPPDPFARREPARRHRRAIAG